MKYIVLILTALALTGCAPKTSAERAARHYAYATPETLNGNFKADRNAIYSINLPIFQKAYNEGKCAKSEGITADVAAKTAQAYYDHAMADRKITTMFTPVPDSKWHNEADLKGSLAFAEGLKSVFLDGYYGR